MKASFRSHPYALPEVDVEATFATIQFRQGGSPRSIAAKKKNGRPCTRCQDLKKGCDGDGTSMCTPCLQVKRKNRECEYGPPKQARASSNTGHSARASPPDHRYGTSPPNVESLGGAPYQEHVHTPSQRPADSVPHPGMVPHPTMIVHSHANAHTPTAGQQASPNDGYNNPPPSMSSMPAVPSPTYDQACFQNGGAPQPLPQPASTQNPNNGSVIPVPHVADIYLLRDGLFPPLPHGGVQETTAAASTQFSEQIHANRPLLMVHDPGIQSQRIQTFIHNAADIDWSNWSSWCRADDFILTSAASLYSSTLPSYEYDGFRR